MHFQWLFQEANYIPSYNTQQLYAWTPGELKQLIQAVRHEDEQAKFLLCQRFEPLVMSVIHRMNKRHGYNWEELQDIAWKHFLEFIYSYEGSDEDYLTLPSLIGLRIYSRILRDCYNNTRYDITQGTDLEDEEALQHAYDNQIDKYITSDSLKQALATLPPVKREIILRTYYDNQSTEEVAAAVKLTPRRVNQLIQETLKLLASNICS